MKFVLINCFVGIIIVIISFIAGILATRRYLRNDRDGFLHLFADETTGEMYAKFGLEKSPVEVSEKGFAILVVTSENLPRE